MIEWLLVALATLILLLVKELVFVDRVPENEVEKIRKIKTFKVDRAGISIAPSEVTTSVYFKDHLNKASRVVGYEEK